MVQASTAHDKQLGQLACWLEEEARRLVTCDRVRVYVVRNGGATVSTWAKVERSLDSVQIDHVLSEEEQKSALRVMFTRFCQSDTHNELAAMGSRAHSINFTEFELLLDELKIVPKIMSTSDAAALFKKANRRVAIMHVCVCVCVCVKERQ